VAGWVYDLSIGEKIMTTEISHFPPPRSTRQSDLPTPGYYVLRLIKGGPFVGGEIRLVGGEWSAMIDGDWEGPSANPWLLPRLVQLHHYGKFSTESEVQFRIGQRRWAMIYAPSHSAANPRRAIDLDSFIPF
jgi:hypothetical protein